MAQSFSAVYVHIVFSTKGRHPFLVNEGVRQDLHQYIGGIVNHNGAQPLIVGGVEDHVHLLVQVGRSVTIASLVKEIKRASSIWIKEQGVEYREFHWQSGYAAFSIGYREIESVRVYIVGQVEHHRKFSFQDEYRAILIENGIELDEKYMWE
jgi:REP element-mobilizing transposase RayT